MTGLGDIYGVRECACLCISHKDRHPHTAPLLLSDQTLSPAAEWIPEEEDNQEKPVNLLLKHLQIRISQYKKILNITNITYLPLKTYL